MVLFFPRWTSTNPRDIDCLVVSLASVLQIQPYSDSGVWRPPSVQELAFETCISPKLLIQRALTFRTRVAGNEKRACDRVSSATRFYRRHLRKGRRPPSESNPSRVVRLLYPISPGRNGRNPRSAVFALVEMVADVNPAHIPASFYRAGSRSSGRSGQGFLRCCHRGQCGTA